METKKVLQQLSLFCKKASVHLNKGKLFEKQLSLPNVKRKCFASVCLWKMISFSWMYLILSIFNQGKNIPS